MSDDYRGFTCECGERYEYPPHVRNHKYHHLLFSCPKCLRKYHIYNCSASLVPGSEPVALPPDLFPDLEEGGAE